MQANPERSHADQDMPQYYNFTISPGNTYDYKPYNASIEAEVYNAMYGTGNCYDMTVACYNSGLNDVCSAADNFCINMVESVIDNVDNRDEYDIRELSPDPFPYGFWVDYLNTPKVQQAVGAFVNFSSYSPTVGTAFGTTGDDDRQNGTIAAMRSLVEAGVYVVSYAGDADYNCNWLGGQAVAAEINATGFSSAGFTNISTTDDVVHGQVKQASNYAFVRVYESGHEVPFYQPVLALEMFERAITGKDLATGEKTVTSGYLTVGTKESTYREGNSTIQYEVLPTDTTYNTTTGAPNPSSESSRKRSVVDKARSSKDSKRPFKPTRGGRELLK